MFPQLVKRRITATTTTTTTTTRTSITPHRTVTTSTSFLLLLFQHLLLLHLLTSCKCFLPVFCCLFYFAILSFSHSLKLPTLAAICCLHAKTLARIMILSPALSFIVNHSHLLCSDRCRDCSTSSSSIDPHIWVVSSNSSRSSTLLLINMEAWSEAFETQKRERVRARSQSGPQRMKDSQSVRQVH